MIDTKRITYIDVLKGFTIVWIVWWHTKHPAFINPYYHVPLFFFISGLFFKPYPFIVFLRKKINSLVIPLCFFYCLAYVWRIFLYAVINGRWNAFNYSHFWDFFSMDQGQNYLFVDVPLWFLMSLIVIEFLYYGLSRLVPKWAILILALACIILKNWVTGFSSPFMINNSMYWWTFFALGNCLGPKLVQLIRQKKYLIVLCLFSFGFYLLHQQLQVYSFIVFAFCLFAAIGNSYLMKGLKYCGVNSLIIFGLHSPILIAIGHYTEAYYNYKAPIWTGSAEAILTVIILCLLARPLNYLLNKISIPRLSSCSKKQ